MKSMNYILGVIVLGCLCGLSIRAFMSKSGQEEQEKPIVVKTPGVKAAAKERKIPVVRSGARIRAQSARSEREKPSFVLDDDDESNLTEVQRRLIVEIREALDREDKATVLNLVQKMQSSDEWPDGIPKAIKLAAIDALSWFGSSGLPEIAGFLADGDDEVVQTALDKFEEALSDFDLSDFERAEILIQAAKIVTDADAMDSMLFELNNMRHSVAVDTIKEMMVSGSEATKSVLPDNIEFYTGEEGIDSPEKLDEWLVENPDDEDDDDFYGQRKEGQ